MMQLTHGTVTLQGNGAVSASVQTLTFPNFVQNAANPTPPIGTAGVLIINDIPSGRNFLANDIIVYTDSNNNNTRNLLVASVVGPCRYNITAQ